MGVRFKLFEQRGFKLGGHFNVNDVNEQQLLFAGVVTALVDGMFEQLRTGNAKCFDNQRRQCLLVMVKRQLEFSEADHVGFRGSVFRIKVAF